MTKPNRSKTETPTGQPKPRQRRFNPKVRTGCKNCRLRRVKCGEEKPACRRCVSSNRVCDGYEPIRIAQTSTSSTGELTLKWIRPTSLPDTTVEEDSAFHHFRVHVVDSLAGLFDSCVWHRHVISIAMHEPAARNAAIALGALERHEDDGSNDELALKHYSMSMRALHDKIPLQGQAATQLILVTCLLFVAFELRKNGWLQARSHLNGGMKIIQSQDDPSPSSAGALQPLVEAFERLDIQVSLFTSARTQLNRPVMDEIKSPANREVVFSSINEAHHHLNLRMAAMSEFVHFADQHRFTAQGKARHGYEPYEEQLLQQLRSLRDWELAMSQLMLKLTRPKDLSAARILQTHHICCRLMVSTSLTDGREMLWDSYIPDFERIIEIAEELPPMLPKTARRNFMLDMGIVSPLYFTALKCRDPILRRRAIQILQEHNSQEGAWDSRTMAAAASSLMFVEERGLHAPRRAADIPETKRLYRAHYDLTKSEKRLYCKRRRFESDGEWIEYTESLGLWPGSPIKAEEHE
ncbi:uncharacterized protein LTR77_006848 [Saxophila tyrrhenica]|uniref:Zn(2)-C6 fungal-type domain-containing protein n=1 Tax=Saxophila tyrrhenica TaxID=1690608 RepID=A0AAV9P6N9_9PEZI|nr:hypothetical protein LTR77_006848 [Saxophila tyrrhenica]